MPEIKQTNFRLNADTAEAFRRYCEENGITAAAGFDNLMEILALDKAKDRVPARKTEIEEFEHHAKALIASFVSSVALNEDAEARIKDRYAGLMASKDQIIEKYQKDLKAAEEDLQDFADKQKLLLAADMEIALLKADLEGKNEESRLVQAQAQKTLEDKDRILSMLQEKLDAAVKAAEGYEDLLTERDRLVKEVDAAKASAKEMQREHELQVERSSIAAEKALYDAVRVAEAAMRAEVKSAQDALVEVTREFQMADRETSKELREKDKEITTLKTQINSLQAQLRTAQNEVNRLKQK